MDRKINVPIIAITPEAEEDDDHNYSTLADALTDVETIEFDDNRRGRVEKSRHKLKIKLTGQEGAVTDTEDMEGSGDEIDVQIVPYDKPVSIDELDLDPGECKETHKIRSRNSQGKKKLHTHSSTVTEANPRARLDNFDINEGTTDVEECVASDEDAGIVEESMVPDHLLEAEITTQISDKLGLSASNVEHEVRRLTDVEKLDSDTNSEGEQRVVQRRRVKRRRYRPSQIESGDDSDASDGNYNIKFGQSLASPRPVEQGLTDVEMLDSNDDNDAIEIPVAIMKRCRKGNSTDEEVVSDAADVSYHIEALPDAPLPKPYRKLITVRDAHDRPIVTITPIEDTYRSEFQFDYGGETDEEFLSDTDALLFAEALSRGPTPELSIFDGGFDDVTESIRMRRRRSLKPISSTIAEELTDTEDIAMVGRKNRRGSSRYLSSLTVSRGEELPLTDTEDLFLNDHDPRRRNSGTDLESILMSDDEYLSEKVDLLRALSTTPIAMREMGGDTILSMEGVGPFSDQSRLSVNRRVSLIRDYASPMPTDTEDFGASDAEDEVMYLKGGSFREVCTDTEDANASDDEYHACLNKKKFSVDILSDNNVLVSMKKTCANLKDCPGPFRSKSGKGEVASGLPEPTLPRQPVPFRDVGEEGGDPEVPTQGPSSHSSQRYVTDQHQLSEEMKQLLRDMEEESKK